MGNTNYSRSNQEYSRDDRANMNADEVFSEIPSAKAARRIDAEPHVIQCYSPTTRAHLGTVPIDSPAAVKEKIERARAAQRVWGKTSVKTRAQVLHRFADRLIDDADRLVDIVTEDSGKTRENALMGEIWPVCDKLRWHAKKGPKFLRPERVSTGTLVHKRARIEYKPMGVIGAILPWNYPFQNLLNPVIPALLAGNAVVLKPSEWVAWSSHQIVEWMREILQDEGHSPELIQVAQGFGETGKAVIEHGVDKVLFIGSGGNGQRVLETAAQHLVPVVLELGGKDPLIVCDDANIQHAVDSSMSGVFINCGQNCVAAERILVQEAIAEDFERRAKARVASFRQGKSTAEHTVEVGAMITPLQLEHVEDMVQSALEEGARLVIGGKRVHADQGDYYAPTILADVRPDMRIMNEELFGPVMVIAPVKSDEHALEIANGTPFGLGASVFTKNRKRARALTEQIEAGMVTTNDFGGMSYMAQGLPFGGVKQSGFGQMNGREGLRSLTVPRAVLEDRFPFSVPAKALPVQDGSYDMQRIAVRAVYSRSIGQKIKAFFQLMTGRA